jgi:endonuclease I
MIRNLILTVQSSIIFSGNNPDIYNIKNINFKSRPTLEHIFPKCYMNKISYNDLHNIFKCNDEINNKRSNYKFTEFENFDDLQRVLMTDNYISIKNKVFIPEDESKGIISRSIMYIAYEYNLRYSKVIDTENLIDWCLRYPPIESEINHNNMVFKKQYKRNKFIDLYNKKNYEKYIKGLFKE